MTSSVSKAEVFDFRIIGLRQVKRKKKTTRRGLQESSDSAKSIFLRQFELRAAPSFSSHIFVEKVLSLVGGD